MDRTPPTYAALLASRGYRHEAAAGHTQDWFPGVPMDVWYNAGIGYWFHAGRDGRWFDSLGYEGTTLRGLREALHQAAHSAVD